MKNSKISLLLILLFLDTVAFAQRNTWSGQILLATSHMLGDLGGKSIVGTHDFSDINLSSTRYAVGTGISYNFSSQFALGMEVNYSRLYSDDNATNSNRRFRNLHSRTDIIESNIKLEYTIPRMGIYLNVGGGLCFYQPMASVDNNWYKLRPLGTEGQNIDANRDPYSIYSPIVPFGIGKKFKLNRIIFAVDVSMRKTFTDYLDDVSTSYYDPISIGNHSGGIAALLSNPSKADSPVGKPGTKRGEPNHNDNYFFVGFKLYLPLTKKYNMHKSCPYNSSWIQPNGQIPKYKKGRRNRRRKK
ncbi:hypothetical protein OAP11_01685 [Bacteroidia bacterium]|nr:hypothetical protein [Bacteroidia bacterium]